MQNQGLLFIPDISGFTRFVNEIEIGHSRFIIQQLLEVLINANEMGLEISEIEGDAILFYKFGDPVELEKIYQQVETMFRTFHQYLVSYDQRKICQCKACISAAGLTLKVITHYGEYTSMNVKNFSKLIGKDVILAHQLLKNDIPQHEYWLVTENVAENMQPATFAQWMQWQQSVKQTEQGKVTFYYTLLTPLKEAIPKHPPVQIDLSQKTKMVSITRPYAFEIKRLVYTVVHLDLRHLWFVGTAAVDEVEHFLPGVGTRHRHVLTNGKTITKSISSFVYDPEGQTIISETDEKTGTTIHFLMEKTGEYTSRLTMELYIDKNILTEVMFKLAEKKKVEEEFHTSVEQLDKVARETVIPLEF
ncbi:MAG TPA: DUF2652 domain-containing protein [Chitinophagaceae bacterium]|nr:DUF2652 domain-containing protein [Chitinophagaceae bacterium]